MYEMFPTGAVGKKLHFQHISGKKLENLCRFNLIINRKIERADCAAGTVGTFGIPKIIWNFGMITENKGDGHRDARSGIAARFQRHKEHACTRYEHGACTLGENPWLKSETGNPGLKVTKHH